MNGAEIAGAAALGAALVGAWGAVHPQSQIFGRTIRETGDAQTLALTFDDGPNPAATPALLDLLDQHNALATFFLVGSRVRAFPEITREITARGHTIGNHTETHVNLIFLSREKLREELNCCGEAIHAAVDGGELRWMRPPFGFRGPQLGSVVRGLGYSGVVMWSKWAWDWMPQPASRVIHRLRRVFGGDILLLHDGDHRVPEGDRRHTVEALRHWLPRWKDAGIRFVTLDTIGDTAAEKIPAAAGEKT
jgi:peptidoglycan-N-acetylglucosamine deacetylase